MAIGARRPTMKAGIKGGSLPKVGKLPKMAKAGPAPSAMAMAGPPDGDADDMPMAAGPAGPPGLPPQGFKKGGKVKVKK